MASNWKDTFDRSDRLGLDTSLYLVPCGQVGIFDESVLPVAESGTGESPFGSGVDEKTQVFYAQEALDSPDQVVRCVWGHDDVTPSGVDSPPSFTILARMTKDPLLLDLGGDEQPSCYDQGYGLRVTCPINGAAPVLKIVKFTTDRRAPNIPRPASAEPDGAVVLASVTLRARDLNVDPNGTGIPYRGFWQDMRFRLRRTEDQVVLEAFLNDLHLTAPILSYTDTTDPVWSSVGLSGFEFISARLTVQPGGASPFEQGAKPYMRCTLLEIDTLKVFRRPQVVTPGNYFTYNRLVQRVITLVEKNGDAKYTASLAGQTKVDTYLDFVHEAEMAICRKEGYWHWLRQEQRIYLKDSQAEYELPETCAELQIVRPGTWNAPPLVAMDELDFYRQTGSNTAQGGQPRVFYMVSESVNNRPTIHVFPTPSIADDTATDPYVVAIFYARPIRPTEPDVQIPLIPQHHIDVLIYAATAHALLLDTDSDNAQFYISAANSKLTELRRENNRKLGNDQLIMRQAADISETQITSRVPILRSTSLEGFLI